MAAAQRMVEWAVAGQAEGWAVMGQAVGWAARSQAVGSAEDGQALGWAVVGRAVGWVAKKLGMAKRAVARQEAVALVAVIVATATMEVPLAVVVMAMAASMVATTALVVAVLVAATEEQGGQAEDAETREAALVLAVVVGWSGRTCSHRPTLSEMSPPESNRTEAHSPCLQGVDRRSILQMSGSQE